MNTPLGYSVCFFPAHIYPGSLLEDDPSCDVPSDYHFLEPCYDVPSTYHFAGISSCLAVPFGSGMDVGTFSPSGHYRAAEAMRRFPAPDLRRRRR